MPDQKYSGTLMSIKDDRIEPETRFHLSRLAKNWGNAVQFVVAFDKPVHAPGGTGEDVYKYALLGDHNLAEVANHGLLADAASKRVTVGIDRLKGGLCAFDCRPAVS